MEDKKEKYEEKMQRYEASGERRSEAHIVRNGRRPWHQRGKVWLVIGVVLAVILLLYWILFLGIWAGPNQ